jgi:2-keto-4-pentenoate hydratase/2-oxohepta-3-ene-1,7-dioic acid hydratase in catechol pathway
MKIVVIDNSFRGSVGEEPSVTVYPDSCLFRNNDPFFLTRLDTKITLTAGFYFKVGKIGKSIQPEFADRYLSHIGIAFDFANTSLEKELIAKQLNNNPAHGFDRSMAISNDMIDYDPAKLKHLSMRLKIKDSELTFTIQALRFSIQEMLAAATKHYTIKIGDLFFVPFIQTDKGIDVETIIDGSLQNSHILRCQIK